MKKAIIEKKDRKKMKINLKKILHLPPYLTTRAPRALNKNTNHVRNILTKFGPDRA